MESVRAASSDDLDTLVEFATALSAELAPMRGGALWTRRDARPAPLRDAFVDLLADPDAVVRIGCLDGAAVVSRHVSPQSLMPAGLINAMNADEVLNLVAYLQSGGNPKHPAFAK